MPLSVSRLRIWFASAAIFLLILVAGFYTYGRHRLRRLFQSAPQKLGVEIQQSTQGFTLSKSQGGHTLFTLHASNAVQYKQGGKAELKDVSIVVYGRESNRYDQIYGSDFAYDPQTGNVTAQGEVHIDLEGNASGEVRSDQVPPRELKNPIHLKTSGLVFNKDTGIAHTKERIEFRVPQISGSALGAKYDPKANALLLDSNIRLQTSGEQNSTLVARKGEITKNPRRVALEDAKVTRNGSTVDAGRLTVFLRPDNTVDHVLASDQVSAQVSGKSAIQAQAPQAELRVNGKNELQSALLTGGVSVNVAGDRAMQGSAGSVLVDFGRNARADSIRAAQDVHLLQPPPPGKDGQTIELTSDVLDFHAAQGKNPEHAETSGAAAIQITPPAGGGGTAEAGAASGPTVITATRFFFAFDDQNRLKSVVGSPNAKLVSTAAGQPDRTSTSTVLTATLSPAGGISSLVQEGDFHYREPAPAGTASPNGREAWANKATYNPNDGMLALTGNPRFTDGGVTTTADRLRINRRSGDAVAEGNVKTTYSELKQRPNGALLATADPIHVTAVAMTARRATGSARYTGNARLWQTSNAVEAPTIDFDRDHRSVVASAPAGQVVSTVFVQQGDNGKQTPVKVTASRLNYVDADRKGHFEGRVVLRSIDGTVTAESLDAFLQPHSASSPGPEGGAGGGVAGSTGNQLDHVVAQGQVVVQQGNRRATGQRLEYLPREGRFRLTGGPPSIFDAEHGNVTGDSLTFFSHDDRVLVEGGKTSPSVTKARVSK
ncbi:MAG TPA: LptA/OstA family protein, partial [Terriglobales bacterium]|nr:LptA/OstA family protein [Terriglobales bacterium]